MTNRIYSYAKKILILSTLILAMFLSGFSQELSIDDVSNTEGGNLLFTVTLNPAAGTTVTVDFASADQSATLADSDYSSNSGTLTFNAGETTKNITISTTADNHFEENEVMLVNLTDPSNATISDSQGEGTITNDDTAPSISISDESEDEGTNLGFTVSLSNRSYQSITVDFASADQSATLADSDYSSNSGTLTFNAGETTKNITISTTADNHFEENEVMLVNLTNPSNATISDSQGEGTITNDDTAPSISISDESEEEGTNLVFTVTLSNRSYQAISVNYATANGTATAGSDYTAITSTTLNFSAGDLSKDITVSTTDDSDVEGSENMTVNLSGPVNATISDNQGTGTITDNDVALPTLSIDDAAENEGTGIQFTVTLSAASASTVTVDFASADQSATLADSDYSSNSGTLTFNAGETTKNITISTTTDTHFEQDEVMLVNLTNPSNATISDSQGEGTITNDDTAPSISISDESEEEGTNLVFTVTLSNRSYQAISVNYATANGTATAGSDYTAITSTTLNFSAGDLSKDITVSTTDDSDVEGSENMTVNLSGPVNVNRHIFTAFHI